MASSNPVFNNSPAFSPRASTAAQLVRQSTPATMSAQELTELYSQPSATPAQTDRMSYEDTIVKIAVSFGILAVGAIVGWMLPALFLPAMIVGFVLALVNIFKKKPSRALVLSYAAVEGVFVGGISSFFEASFPGIVSQAVLGTLVVVGVTLALFASGKVRASKGHEGLPHRDGRLPRVLGDQHHPDDDRGKPGRRSGCAAWRSSRASRSA